MAVSPVVGNSPESPNERDSGSGAGAADGAADGAEGAVGVVAQGGDGADAHDDDQGQHDRVLDGGRAVLGLDELHDALGELTHGCLQSVLSASPAQLPVPPMVVPTLVNVLLALLPSVVTAPMHTTMIRASMTAYSTAVGPSSSRRNCTAALPSFLIRLPLFAVTRDGFNVRPTFSRPPVPVSRARPRSAGGR